MEAIDSTFVAHVRHEMADVIGHLMRLAIRSDPKKRAMLVARWGETRVLAFERNRSQRADVPPSTPEA
jgi:hypothetical protein